MAYNTIYYGSFQNILDDKIDVYIKQLDFAGEPSALIFDANPITITYSKRDFYESIFGCGVKINVINPSQDFFKFDSLFRVPEKNNYVEIIRTHHTGDSSIILFQGYVLPDMYQTTLEKNIKLTIPAIDQLSLLNRYTPEILVDTTTYRADEFVSAIDILGNILLTPEVTDKVHINNELVNINYVKDSSSTVFDNIFFTSDVFEEKRNVMDSKKIIERILKPFYSRVYYYDGKYRIERVADLGNEPKSYAVYSPDACTFSITDTNERINLSCPDNYFISGQSALSYNPGYQQVNCKLNYKEPDSLTENYYYDVQALDPCTASEPSAGGYMPLGRPTPIYREWMVSKTPHNNTYGNWFGGAPDDSSLWTMPDDLPKRLAGFEETAVYFSAKKAYNLLGWTSAAQIADYSAQTLSTSFNFTPILPSQYNSINIDVKYKVCIPGDAVYTTPSSATWQTRFSLRAVDSNDKNWWLAKMSSSDTSTYWKSTPYTFDTEILKSDLETDNEGAGYLRWDISKTVEMTSPIMTDVSVCYAKKRRRVMIGVNDSHFFVNSLFNRYVTYSYYVPTSPEYIGKLYLDFYIPRIKVDYAPSPPPGPYDNVFVPFLGWIGDVDVDIKTDTPNNYLDTSIGYSYDTKETELDIFDSESIMFENGIYQMDSEDQLHSVKMWRSRDYDSYIKIQDKYLEDMTQMMSEPHYGLTVDVKAMDSSVHFSIGNIYTHDALVKDGSILEFMCNGMEMNVRENTYRLDLLEYTPDKGWRVDPSTCTFSYSPTSLSFDSYGYNIEPEIAILTNRPYSLSSSENWISWTLDSSAQITVDVSVWADETKGRDGSIYINSIDCDGSVHIISIHQDASTGPAYTIDVTPAYYIFSTAGGVEGVATVTCSEDGSPSGWTAAIISDTQGIITSFPITSGNSGDTIWVMTDQNAATFSDCQMAVIEVSCGTAQAYLTIQQDGYVFPC